MAHGGAEPEPAPGREAGHEINAVLGSGAGMGSPRASARPVIEAWAWGRACPDAGDAAAAWCRLWARARALAKALGRAMLDHLRLAFNPLITTNYNHFLLIGMLRWGLLCWRRFGTKPSLGTRHTPVTGPRSSGTVTIRTHPFRRTWQPRLRYRSWGWVVARVLTSRPAVRLFPVISGFTPAVGVPEDRAGAWHLLRRLEAVLGIRELGAAMLTKLSSWLRTLSWLL